MSIVRPYVDALKSGWNGFKNVSLTRGLANLSEGIGLANRNVIRTVTKPLRRW